MRRLASIAAAGFLVGAVLHAATAAPQPAAGSGATYVAAEGDVIYVPPGITVSSVSGTLPPEVPPSPSASSTTTPTATPTASATATPTTTASRSPTTTSTPTPTASAPSATPTVPPGPTLSSPSGSDFILIARADLMTLPTSGAAWQGVLTQAAKTPDVDLSDLNADGDVVTLAKALVYARTGNAARRTDVIAALDRARASSVSQALELARGVGAYVLAADLVGYRDQVFTDWAKAQRTRAVTGGPATLTECARIRPNNWGTWCRSSLLIIDLYVGDSIANDVSLFRGWLGDRAQYAGFTYGDLSWQADASKPVGINPAGATKQGRSVDGVLPDDQRRAGSFSWPPPCENYVAEALQGVTLEATVLERAGQPAWSWSNQAIGRSVEFRYSNGCPFTDDDSSTPFVTDAAYGTSHAGSSPSQPGKGWGYGDWLFQ